MVGRSRDDLKASLGTADGLIVRSETRVDRDLLAAGPKLTVVARAGVGVDSIDVPAATDAASSCSTRRPPTRSRRSNSPSV